MRLLVAIDEAPEGRLRLHEVARRLAPRPDATVVLCHVLPPPPPELREHPGAENPDLEERLERELDTRRRRWRDEQARFAERILERGVAALEEGGLPPARVESRVHECLGNACEVALGLLDEARRSACDAIAVERRSRSWPAELLEGHVSDELLRRGDDVPIWIVDGHSPPPEGLNLGESRSPEGGPK